MASAVIFTSTSSIVCLASLSSSSHTSKKQAATVSFPDYHTFEIPVHLGFTKWNGLKKIQGISTSTHLLKIGMKRKRRNKGVYASLFGVGAPEALVIGVVALLVFGPKGLAEVARNLGKTLRAFQPTIRELQDVSREFKSTLEREIGLDDIQTTSNGSPSTSKAYSSEDYLKITEEQLRAASAVQKQEDKTLPNESRSDVLSPTTQEGSISAPTGESSTRDAREVGASTMSSGQTETEIEYNVTPYFGVDWTLERSKMKIWHLQS